MTRIQASGQVEAGVTLIHIIRNNLGPEQIHLVKRLKLAISFKKIKDLRLEAVSTRVLVEQREERIVVGFFQLQSCTEPGCQQPGKVGLPHSGNTLNCDVARWHDQTSTLFRNE